MRALLFKSQFRLEDFWTLTFHVTFQSICQNLFYFYLLPHFPIQLYRRSFFLPPRVSLLQNGRFLAEVRGQTHWLPSYLNSEVFFLTGSEGPAMKPLGRKLEENLHFQNKIYDALSKQVTSYFLMLIKTHWGF